jgi:hypothetical protein
MDALLARLEAIGVRVDPFGDGKLRARAPSGRSSGVRCSEPLPRGSGLACAGPAQLPDSRSRAPARSLNSGTSPPVHSA